MDESCMIRQKIVAYDFAIVDLNLYLDTHPEDRQAMCLFRMYQEKRQALIEKYEQKYGAYINTVNDVQGEKFTWICDPWPWEYSKGV